MKAGDKLVCIKPFKRIFANVAQRVPDYIRCPEYLEICVFDGLGDPGYIYLEGYVYFSDYGRIGYRSTNFVPLDDWKQAEYMTEELIQETLMPVEI